MKCPICHLNNQDDARFCCHCGNVLSGESLAVSITDAANIIGCTTQTVLNLIDRGYLTQMGADAPRKTYISRESLLRFCNVIPDFKGKITALRGLYKQVKKAQEDLQSQLGQYESDALFSNISLRKNMVELLMNLRLSEKEKRVLQAFIYENLTLEELAEKYDTTKERIRQIKETAIRKMAGKIPEDCTTYESLLNKNRELQDTISLLETILSNKNIEYKQHILPLQTLDFSPRTLAALLSSGFHYLSDIAQYSRVKLYTKLRSENISSRAMNEIETVLKQHGLSLQSANTETENLDWDDEEDDVDEGYFEDELDYDDGDETIINSIIKHGKIQGVRKKKENAK